MDRKLAAILAADVVGYSRLMGADEAGTFAAVKDRRETILVPVVTAHGGRIVDFAGDGAMVEFASAVKAVEAAVELQRRFAVANEGIPDGRQILWRIGINLGDVIGDGGSIYGDSVNIAARLEQLADPGGIWVSGKVAREVERKLASGFEPMGTHQVKNIAEPVEAFRVKLEGAPPLRRMRATRAVAWPWPAALAAAVVLLALTGAYLWRSGDAGANLSEKPAIAVLPFDNLGDDPKWDRLADAMTEDVITDLSHSKDLLVIARNSTEVYKGKAVDIRQVGRDLDVRYVLEGSVQPAGESLRATAQLIDAKTGNHVWSERFERPAGDIFAVEAEITERIAATLTGFEGIIAGAERQIVKRKPPQNLTAFDAYLLGMEAKRTVTKEGFLEAERLFKQAITLDPHLARAYVGLTLVYLGFVDLSIAKSVPETLDNALDSAKRAVALDPDDGEAQLVLGAAYGFRGELEKQIAGVERAEIMAPNNADLLMLAAWSWSFLGKPEHAVELAGRILRLNPRYPYWYIPPLRAVYFSGRDFETSLGYAKRITDPTAWDYAYIAASAARLGRMEEAKAAADKIAAADARWSAEQWISDSGGFAREEDAELFVDGVRKAGGRACLTVAELKERSATLKIKSCEAERAKS